VHLREQQGCRLLRVAAPPPHQPPRQPPLQLTSCADGSLVLHVHLDACTGVAQEVLGAALSALPALQTVLLRGCGITSLDSFSLLAATVVDFAHNSISALATLDGFARRSPNGWHALPCLSAVAVVVVVVCCCCCCCACVRFLGGCGWVSKAAIGGGAHVGWFGLCVIVGGVASSSRNCC
jgi:hypothetical protein